MKESQFQFQPVDAPAYKTFTHAHEYNMALTFHFCGNCGVMLWKTADAEEFKGAVCVNAGTLDDLKLLNELKPTKEFWTQYRTEWVPVIEGTAQQIMYNKD